MRKYITMHPPSKIRVIWTIVLSSIILVTVYLGIFQLHYYNKEALASLQLLVTVNCIVILRKIWLETRNRLWIELLLFLLLIITVRSGTMGVLQLQKIYNTRQLKNHGKIVDGEVLLSRSQEFPLFYKRYILVRYSLNRTNFLRKIDNENQRFTKGDKLKLRISAQHPGILELAQY